MPLLAQRAERRQQWECRAPRGQHKACGAAMSTILVTGAAGFVGSHLVDRLLALGNDVVGLDALDDYYDPEHKRANLQAAAENPRFRFLEADLVELRSEHLDSIDAIFHLAGQPGVRGSWGAGFARYLRNNVVATQHLLELCRGRDLRKIVYASSSSVYGNVPAPQREDGPANPHSPYGVTKLAAEHLCSLYARNDAMPAVSVRFFTVYGPRQRPDMAFDRFLRAIRAGRTLRVFGDGSQARDFTYVDDIVEGMLRAAQRGRNGETYNLGGGTRIALIDAIHAMERATGRTAKVEFAANERGDVAQTSAYTGKASAELGYAPRIGIDEGIARHAAALGMRRFTQSLYTARSPRIAIYSHDTYGLGHLRRNLAIAERLLKHDPPFEVLLVTGSPVVDEWVLPHGLDLEPLPPVVKIGADRYASRDTTVDFETIKSLREQVILRALLRFHPDALLVDHAPAGMKGELLPFFEEARLKLPSTRLVLGLRDIIDDPIAVRTAWESEQILPLIERTYDRVFIYGSPEIFSPIDAYGFPASITRKTQYCGYVARRSLAEPTTARTPKTPLRVLVSAGGGGDGFPLLRDVLCALERLASDSVEATLLAGPLMPAEEYDMLAHAIAAHPGARLVRATSEPERFLADADLAIAMGGYNTVTEILASRTAAVLVPRTAPRVEQKLRAELLCARGLAWAISEGSVVERLAEHLQAAIAGARPARIDRHELDLGGAAKAVQELHAMLENDSLAAGNRR